MVKLTKRKGFNFFRSYYDVYNELESKDDKIAFIEALLDRQFLGIKPKGLKGMAKFAYISQTNSIDSQVKGYEDKTKNKLTDSQLNTTPTEGGTQGGTQGGYNTPSLQEEVEEEVEEEVDITHQKKGSEFFTKTSIRKAHQDNRELFNEIERTYKPVKTCYSEIEYFNAIAKKIRDTYRNREESKRRKAEKYNGMKSLFD